MSSSSVETTQAFIYDRYATTTTTILDIRLDRCRAYASSRGWEIVGTWLDLGDHALGDYRPQFTALCLALQETRGPVVCLVDGWDRLSRDLAHRRSMRTSVRLAGGHCETVEGETDREDEKARSRLGTPHRLPLSPDALSPGNPGLGGSPSHRAEECR